MFNINDIKGKVGIINYEYLIFGIFVILFVYLFYIFLNKIFNKKEVLEEEKCKNILIKKINNLEKEIETINSKDFYEKLGKIFFEFLGIYYQKDLSNSTFYEIKKNIQNEEFLSFLNIFYYKGFMEKIDFDNKETKIENIKKISNFVSKNLE